jgi:predicted nucleic acid-binding protein
LTWASNGRCSTGHNDTISEILRRRNATIEKHASRYLSEHSAFAYSAITHYELVRGLLWKQATRKLREYRVFASNSSVFPLSETVLERAAELWVDGQRAGRPHNDADLIIAASALLQARVLVTGNTSHFDWIAGLSIANWREP